MLDREPLLTRAAIVSAVAAVVAILGTFGFHVAPQLQDGIVQLITLAAILGPIVAAYLARAHVTPVASPQDAEGNPLVPDVGADVAASADPATQALPTAPPTQALPTVQQ